ncbi:uncharacterized protein KY384_004675 [Bacidia gigantensis]|uniref:uncharacterized protein n=1 Tax=Bacidia gigantensis TaxID=2732470 RepID=UPI001D03C55D|nr:uncharacterized protein KY384_004675 [Bacidia gigantensis]KAG8530637.1 hypothetical protein KY384_004675 [Bacidia gigantensis]
MSPNTYTVSKRKGAAICYIKSQGIAFDRAFPRWDQAPESLGANTLSATKKVVFEFVKRSYTVSAIEKSLQSVVEVWEGRWRGQDTNKPSVNQVERLYKHISHSSTPVDPNQPVILPTQKSKSTTRKYRKRHSPTLSEPSLSPSSPSFDTDENESQEEQEACDQDRVKQTVKNRRNKNIDWEEDESENGEEGESEIGEEDGAADGDVEDEVGTGRRPEEEEEIRSQEGFDPSSKELQDPNLDNFGDDDLPLLNYDSDSNGRSPSSSIPYTPLPNKFPHQSPDQSVDGPLRTHSLPPTSRPRAVRVPSVSRRTTRHWSVQTETWEDSDISIEVGRGASHQERVTAKNSLRNEFSSPTQVSPSSPAISSYSQSPAVPTLRRDPYSPTNMARAQSRSQQTTIRIPTQNAPGPAESAVTKAKQGLDKAEVKVRCALQSWKSLEVPTITVKDANPRSRKRKGYDVPEEEAEDVDIDAIVEEQEYQDKRLLEADRLAYEQRFKGIDEAMTYRRKKLKLYIWQCEKAKAADEREEARKRWELWDEKCKAYEDECEGMGNEDIDDEGSSGEGLDAAAGQANGNGTNGHR